MYASATVLPLFGPAVKGLLTHLTSPHPPQVPLIKVTRNRRLHSEGGLHHSNFALLRGGNHMISCVQVVCYCGLSVVTRTFELP